MQPVDSLQIMNVFVLSLPVEQLLIRSLPGRWTIDIGGTSRCFWHVESSAC